MDRHRLVGEELQNRQLVDDAAGDRLDVLDVDPLRAGDLGLYDVAGEERGVVVVGDLAYQRVHVALVGARAGVAVGSLADVLQFDRPLVGVVGEPFELAQSVPARFEPVIGLRLQLADDGLRDQHPRRRVGPVLDPFGHAAVDDRTGVRYYVHTVSPGGNRISVFDPDGTLARLVGPTSRPIATLSTRRLSRRLPRPTPGRPSGVEHTR